MIKLGAMVTSIVTPKAVGVASTAPMVAEKKEIVVEAFSRQHYEEVAKIIKGIGSKFTNLFKKDNSRFDSDRFAEACNVK
jgi:hypothetical protein